MDERSKCTGTRNASALTRPVHLRGAISLSNSNHYTPPVSKWQDLCLFSFAIEFFSILETHNAIYVLALCTRSSAQPGYRRRLSAQLAQPGSV